MESKAGATSVEASKTDTTLRSLVDDKLARVRKALSEFSHAEKQARSSGQKSDALPPGVTANDFTDQLFGRAPLDYMEARSAEELSSIAIESLQHINECLRAKIPVLVKVVSRPNITGFHVLLADSPFIVNTLRECVQKLSVTVHCLLHPVLKINGSYLSVSYLETEALSDEQVRSLTDQIERSLHDLTLVTDDFVPMVSETEQVATTLAPSKKGGSEVAGFSVNETVDFLRWLTNGGFVFLGYASWKTGSKGAAPEIETSLGLFRRDASCSTALRKECADDTRHMTRSQKLKIVKLKLSSPVHRRLRLVHVLIGNGEQHGAASFHSVVGLLTSKGLADEASGVPFVREKLKVLLAQERTLPNSHDYKSIIRIVDSMPKLAALIMDVGALQEEINTIWSIKNPNECRALVRADPAGREAWIMVVVPPDSLNDDLRRSLQKLLEQRLQVDADSVDFHVAGLGWPLSRIYFYAPLREKGPSKAELTRLSQDLVALCAGWREGLRSGMKQSHGKRFAQVWERYADAFPASYQSLYDPAQALTDIESLEKLSAAEPIQISLQGERLSAGGTPEFFLLTVLSIEQEITLSRALPILENAGFEVIHEHTLSARPAALGEVFIHRFRVRASENFKIDLGSFDKILGPGLQSVFLGRAENDLLNALMLRAKLDLRAVLMLRTYCMALWQMRKFASKQLLRATLAALPEAAVRLHEMFQLKFDPSRRESLESRRAAFQSRLEAFHDWLRSVTDLNRDRILRSLGAIVEQTVRTNFYSNPPAVAIKVHSAKLDILPAFRPLFEIFVYAPWFQGVHLRSSKIARGGIRWSDRHDDFRTEILSLMKTQRTKNSLIVPSGAKGGFVVRELPVDREAAAAAVKSAYQGLIRALLSLTDNRAADKIVRPNGLIMYDEEDPYLVVAADKGTATFSNIANQIAVDEFGFWLEDAFASGGSSGYDHKELAITAKGAWETAKQHFREMGLDFEKSPFTVIGIGDMSGDVFGNGLLLSRQMKLLAAFDHRHIFIDPNPGPEASWAERKRLFDLPRSQWKDYNPALFSKGGGVFGRYDKEIRVSNEAREALGIGSEIPETVNGETLISLILKAPVDLFWNGGIGTYVKSRLESDADVDDHSNDRVRINSDELRAKVVAEGGNLGFTQKARIEFAKRGGHINTDAIDNSGGVDMSDHEVNLKLFFSSLPPALKLDRADRDKLLAELTPDVSESVLEHNRNHAIILAVAQSRSKRNLEYYRSLIRDMHRRGYINRSVEFLPDDDELVERAAGKLGLTRPELAICLAAVKMWIKDELLNSDLLKDPLAADFLTGYFPPPLRGRFGEQIRNHPLAQHIAATEISNRLVDVSGLLSVHRLTVSHSVSPLTVLQGMLAARALLDVPRLTEELSHFDQVATYATFIAQRLELVKALRESGSWLISNHASKLRAADVVKLYQAPLARVMANPMEIFSGQIGKMCERERERLIGLGFSEEGAMRFSLLGLITIAFETVWVAQQTKTDIAVAGRVYTGIIEQLGLVPLLTVGKSIDAKSKWEHEVLLNAYDEIRRNLAELARQLMKKGCLDPGPIQAELEKIKNMEQLRGTLGELNGKVPEVALLSVLARQLKLFCL